MLSNRKLLALPLIVLTLISCNLPFAGDPSLGNNPTQDSNQRVTTLAPIATDTVPSIQTATLSQPTNTPKPENTATKTIAPTNTSRPQVTRCNWAQFLGDVTIPDGTVLQTGETFVKKWRLKNIGTCTWDEGYRLVFSSGAAMSGPAEVSLPKVVAPGDTVDALVNLKAPADPKHNTGYWKLVTPAGAQYGIDADAQGAFYVEIEAVGRVTPQPDLVRVNFFANATEGQVADDLSVGQIRSYVLNVAGDQTMMVRVASSTEKVFLRIYGNTTGQVLLENSMGAGQSYWQGKISSTQDYVIQVINRGDSTSFTLNIIIPRTSILSFSTIQPV